MKSEPPYIVWNESVELTGFGKKASAQEGAAILKRLRAELGKDFDRAFRLRMMTVQAHTLEKLLEDWKNERTQLGV